VNVTNEAKYVEGGSVSPSRFLEQNDSQSLLRPCWLKGIVWIFENPTLPALIPMFSSPSQSQSHQLWCCLVVLGISPLSPPLLCLGGDAKDIEESPRGCSCVG